MSEKTISEPAREVPVVEDVDLCVIGGSCTGVFAAVAAARRGAKVAIVENQGFFGGMTTAALISVWHPTFDTEFKKTIIAGLTTETIERLAKRNGVIRIHNKSHAAFIVNTAEMKIELDCMIREARVRPFLHARFAAPAATEGRAMAAIIEDKSGRRAIRAKFFIDATGDGDFIRRLGLSARKLDNLQPPTTAAVFRGLQKVKEKNPGFSLSKAVFDQTRPGALTPGFLWTAQVVNAPENQLIVGTRVNNADCSDADELTRAEMEGRRQVRAMLDVLRSGFDGGEEVTLASLPAHIGVRETHHACCLHTLTEQDVLLGKRFDDAVANGSYCVDVHHSDQQGITFRYLDGRELELDTHCNQRAGRWRPETPENPTFYQIPYRSLVPQNSLGGNVLVAGRLIDADRGAYGAIRVIVNCNQTGEAAGTAAVEALNGGVSAENVNPAKLRAELAKGGAAVL